MFIATANMLDDPAGAAWTAWRSSASPGYTEDEKVEIARRYLLPERRSPRTASSPANDDHDEACRRIIRDYTREAGVRNLEREIATVDPQGGQGI